MPKPDKAKGWSGLKAELGKVDRKGMLDLVHDLYTASPENRRFLHARFSRSDATLEEYDRRVADAIAPDPFSKRPISIRDASAILIEYRRATGDIVGTVGLMLTFVEAGTAYAADFGAGDEAYFDSLERKVEEILEHLPRLPDDARGEAVDRLRATCDRARVLGWGYGDYMNDVEAQL